MTVAGSRSPTVDKYLEAIYCIAAEGEVVRPSRLAYWLGVSAPTVSDALQRLQRDGWVDIGADRSVTLRASGDEAATALVRRHRILERWLTDELGFDWATADVEADRLSSAMSDAVVDQIDVTMGSPATCPHGNVIPGRRAPYGSLVALADVAPGATVTVRRISEVAEHEAPALLTMLAAHAIHEGSDLSVGERRDDARAPKDLAVVVADRTFDLSRDAAQLIWVEPRE